MKLKFLLLVGALLGGSVHAQEVQVSGAWARATVPGQTVSGAFMKLASADGAVLVAVACPLADIAEIHEMKMDGGTMKMRAVPELALPAGQTVELKPGGYHLMLMDLKGALKSGTTLPLVLSVRDRQGRVRQIEVSVPVRQAPPAH